MINKSDSSHVYLLLTLGPGIRHFILLHLTVQGYRHYFNCSNFKIGFSIPRKRMGHGNVENTFSTKCYFLEPLKYMKESYEET